MFKVFLILFFLIACRGKNNDNDFVESLPISPKELHAKQGDCFLFKDSAKNYFIGAILNFYKAKDGIWYIMCFTNFYDSLVPTFEFHDRLKFCGRKVMYMTPGRYTIGFDVVFARDSTVDNNKSRLLGNINLDSLKNIEIVAQENVSNYKQFNNAFHRSKTNRATPPDRYDDLTKEHLRPDEYFTLKEVLEWYKSFKKGALDMNIQK